MRKKLCSLSQEMHYSSSLELFWLIAQTKCRYAFAKQGELMRKFLLVVLYIVKDQRVFITLNLSYFHYYLCSFCSFGEHLRAQIRVVLPCRSTRLFNTNKKIRNATAGGYRGRWKAFHQLKCHYLWQGMSAGVSGYIQTYNICQWAKPDEQNCAGLLYPLSILDKVGCRHDGPHSEITSHAIWIPRRSCIRRTSAKKLPRF